MRHLAVMAKHWTPGLAKTRLAATWGAQRASTFQRLCLGLILARSAAVADCRTLYFTPATLAEDFMSLAGLAWICRPQGAGDLGARLSQVVGDFWGEADTSREDMAQRAVTSGAVRAGDRRSLVIIGSDSPTLPLAFLHEAFERLARHDVVLGPTPDGGYYLIGLSLPETGVFAEIPWSTERVWGATIERLQALNRSWYSLPPWYDVDTADDLVRLREELAGDRGPSSLGDSPPRAHHPAAPRAPRAVDVRRGLGLGGAPESLLDVSAAVPGEAEERALRDFLSEA